MQVPGSKPQLELPGPPQPTVPPQYLAMAAAQMHAEGRWPQPQQVSGTGKGYLYEDEEGTQRDVANDQVIERFRPQIDEMANSLTDSQAKYLDYWYGSGKGKLTKEDTDSMDSIRSKIYEMTKGLPESKQVGNEIQMYNWPSLFLDELRRTHKRKGPGI